MNAIFCVILFLGCVQGFQVDAEPLSVSVSSESAILINADTGAVLFEKEASKQYFPASITKIASALFALKQKGEDVDVLIEAQKEAISSISPAAKRKSCYMKPSYWIETASSHIAIKKGEEMSFNDLLHAMLIASANDASNVIAQYVGNGSIEQFMSDLNLYLEEIGCQETRFLNPHGLHHPDHKTSVRDMALITKEALKFPLFAEIVAKKNYVCAKTNKQPARPISQANLLLKKGSYYYDKAIGVKTGYHTISGPTLVAAARHNERTLIAAFLGYSEKQEAFQDAISLFNAAFAEAKLKENVLTKGVQKYQLSIQGASVPLQTYLTDDYDFEYYPAEGSTLTVVPQWKADLSLPIHKGDQVGTLALFGVKGSLITTQPLYANNNVKASLLFLLKKKLHSYSIVAQGTLFLGMALIAFGIVWWLKNRKKRGAFACNTEMH